MYSNNFLKSIRKYKNKVVEKINILKNINFHDESGSATAEYAIIALCAVAFAGTLLSVIKGGGVQDMLLSIITKALEIV
ncbi:DUF4244 domain-containing protein [Actinomyces sp. zg-332]|uniref:DUF4244 domain-containing protein n=1 Tax=Actinomyces sp. zg-332 TaxID=2708340 RepID=UPI001423B79D|nr:DUF4244 domain-containing protein [Actinomyces sp. zg-332]QPK94099.1 DUF4244 domain-containing protein [Actinomyces sp. zg-332]